MLKKSQSVQKCLGLNEKWRIIKNIVVIGLVFVLQFTAFNGAANLQSSINAGAGLGTASLAAVYGGLVFSNIFLTSAVIKWLGIKLTMFLSLIAYMPYIAVQLWPAFYTFIPAGILVGLGAALLWCAVCLYISVVSETYSKLTNSSSKVVMVRFLSSFYAIVQSNQVWGNLISSLVIFSGGNKAAATSVNASLIPELCGANFLPRADASKALQHQPQEKIQMLVGIFLACMAGALLIFVFGIDSTKRYDTGRKNTSLSGFALLSVTIKLLKEPNQLLLVIITIFTGFQHAFFTADVNAAYVSCSIGTGTVGFVMMVHGLGDLITCAVIAYIAKVVGRMSLIIFAGVVHIALIITILLWKPHAHSENILYIIAAIWGMCNGVWLVQINAFNGILFPGREEAAFSNFRVWDSAGFVIAYIISSHCRTSTKIYFQLVLLVVGLMGFFTIEYRERKGKLIEKQAEKKGCDNIVFTVSE